MYYRKKHGYLFLIIAGIAVMAACAILGYIYMMRAASPNLEEIGQLKAKAMISQIVNDAISQKFSEQINSKEMLNVNSDDNGNVTMVQTDTGAINRLASNLSIELQRRYSEQEESYVDVSLGALIGSSVLSETAPYVTVGVLPLSVSDMKFYTEIKDAGINQTKYKVYAVIHSEVKVLAPFADNIIKVKNTVLIVEAIIVGNVPNSYVEVPENEILDVLD